MANIQTNYNENMRAGVPGMVANTETANSITRVVEGAVAPFGAVAVRGARADQAKVPTAGGSFLGIFIRKVTLDVASNDQYQIGDNSAIHEKGVIWVTASVAVAHGDAAYFTAAGVLTNVSTSNTAIVGGIWDSTTTAVNLIAKLRLK